MMLRWWRYCTVPGQPDEQHPAREGGRHVDGEDKVDRRWKTAWMVWRTGGLEDALRTAVIVLDRRMGGDYPPERDPE